MFVDASVVVAIITREPERERLLTWLAQADAPLVTSAISVWEATVGVFRKLRVPMAVAQDEVGQLLDGAGIKVVGNSPEEVPIALQAFDRYGRHRYPEAERNRALNLADCFHYASATARDLPILTKDIGFGLTDVAVVRP